MKRIHFHRDKRSYEYSTTETLKFDVNEFQLQQLPVFEGCITQFSFVTSILIFPSNFFIILRKRLTYQSSKYGRVDTVIRALAPHQCGVGSIFRLAVICGLSLLVLYSVLRSFSPRNPVFPTYHLIFFVIQFCL